MQQLETVRPQIERAYGKQHVKVEMAKLQVAMMSVLRTRETEVGEKDNEIEHLQQELQQIQVKAPAALWCSQIHAVISIVYT